MADNLPLIPEKESVCADVRPVLREVFRELDYLPPLAGPRAARRAAPPAAGRTAPGGSEAERGEPVGEDGDHALPSLDHWMTSYRSECQELWQHEGELKWQHARRLARSPPPNTFRLRARLQPGREPEPPSAPGWVCERGLIGRHHLVPTLEQNAGRDASLWVQNILSSSSGDVRADVAGCACPAASPAALRAASDFTLQTLSIGEVVSRVPPSLTPEPPAPPVPEYIVCVPPQIDFINFTVGQVYTQTIRLVNVSKFEIRLSLGLPAHRSLDVALGGARGLAVSSGAAGELRVRFAPRSPRALGDRLRVRASLGRALRVPVACYIQPPLLHILVSNDTSATSWCNWEESRVAAGTGSTVLELGSRLLGAAHAVRLQLVCEAQHAAFFVLSEDSWLSCNLDCVTRGGCVRAGVFALWPGALAGGGHARGAAWCRAPAPGLHAAALRVLACNAASRPLHLLADSLLWRPDHVSIQAQEKEYDIMSEEDAACAAFVHLGTAFPRRALAAAVHVVNHSPIEYSYYWSVRPWGVCSCGHALGRADGGADSGADNDALLAEDEERDLCVGAREELLHGEEATAAARESAGRVRAAAARGVLGPRARRAVTVHVDDAGDQLGTRRAVLMLILQDIPTESIPPDVEPMIVSTRVVEANTIPGVQGYRYSACAVVVAQLAVWWRVAPARFALAPPLLPLPHSRRVESIEITLSGTQLYGSEGIAVWWQTPEHVAAPPPRLLAPAVSALEKILLPLPPIPEDRSEIDIITMMSSGPEGSWTSSCEVQRSCGTRHARLRPASCWLGVVPPALHMRTTLHIYNDTHQHICWWAQPYHWWGGLGPVAACAGRVACPKCRELPCACAVMRPSRGALPPGAHQDTTFMVNAPKGADGCVATLVQLRRTRADVARVAGGAGLQARAALVAWRALAPRLALRLLPCGGDHSAECGACNLDAGAGAGAAVLRPRRALALARRACYRLRVTNTTPIATALHWDPPLDGDEVLKVLFIPNSVQIRSYGEVFIQVVVEARRVCGRRVFVRRARADGAHRPVYLLIDAAVAGLELTCEVPLGAALHTDAFIHLRRTQREEFPWDKPKPATDEEIFREHDRKRDIVKANICRCPVKMLYIPPPRRRNSDDSPGIEILTEPPSLSRVCPCVQCARPVVPEDFEPLCLQFKGLPLRTVRSRTVVLRNQSVLTGHWSATVRRWPRKQVRTIDADEWAEGVCAPGAALAVSPAAGTLAARAAQRLRVSVYADCWGLYCDQILIKVSGLEPIVVDVWVEAVGAPLLLALRPTHDVEQDAPTLWMSSSDASRRLRVRNVSRSELVVHAYLLQAHEHPQDPLPFRLYLSFFDLLPRTCACLFAPYSDEMLGETSEAAAYPFEDESDTGVELFLAADRGAQLAALPYTVSPDSATIRPGESFEWAVSLRGAPPGELAPAANLLLRVLPVHNFGASWFRPEPVPLVARLAQAARAGSLRVSCSELRVVVCALALPYGDVLRVRKRFQVVNSGSAPLAVCARTAAPWCVLRGRARGACGAGCAGGREEEGETRDQEVELYLEPRSSTEMCVEVSIRTASAWALARPAEGGQYPPWQRSTAPLHFYDEDNVLQVVSLQLAVEFPVLRVQPAAIDFGFVTDGDTKAAYFTVSHTSKTESINVVTQWSGGPEFRLWPGWLCVRPGAGERVQLHYTAVWQAAPAEGVASVVCAGAAGAWCRAALGARAAPARDHACRRALPAAPAPARDTNTP